MLGYSLKGEFAMAIEKDFQAGVVFSKLCEVLSPFQLSYGRPLMRVSFVDSVYLPLVTRLSELGYGTVKEYPDKYSWHLCNLDKINTLVATIGPDNFIKSKRYERWTRALAHWNSGGRFTAKEELRQWINAVLYEGATGGGRS